MENKRCGLYIRVSSEKQARVEEGSLKNQEQQLTQFVELKQKIGGACWTIIDKYIDGGKSAKDTNRPEYQRMQKDTREGRIDTVLCVALSRISRSVPDLLGMVDDFKEREIDFICLKENFDTTTAQGKCFLTIMAALNQFEREQTSERTRINMRSRAERGLRHGGYILGYVLDPNKRGHQIPDSKEAKLIDHIFDTYLGCGSVPRTAKILNEQGYMSKSYTSTTGIYHSGKPFGYGSVLNVLKNLAYVAVREINKQNKAKDIKNLKPDEQYTTCKAAWEAIVDREKFDRAQTLLKDNYVHRNNGAGSTKHTYIFNYGLLQCEKCGSRMKGRNGHGRGGKIYYYYFCTNPACRFELREDELELAIQALVQGIISRPSILSKIAHQVNAKLHGRLPQLKEQRRVFSGEIDRLNGEATQLFGFGLKNGKEFIEERLANLEGRRKALTEQLEHVDFEIEALENKTIDEENVKGLMSFFEAIFKEDIKPYQKRLLLNHIQAYFQLSEQKFEFGMSPDGFRSDITRLLRTYNVPNVRPGSHSGRESPSAIKLKGFLHLGTRLTSTRV